MKSPVTKSHSTENREKEEDESFVVVGTVGNEKQEKGDDPNSDTFVFTESLPDEMLQEIFKFLSLYDILNVELVNKRWRRLAKNFTKQKRILWKWGTEKKSENIELDSDRTTCSRPTSKGHNPAILAEKPLSRECNHFRVQVDKLGKWVGIGIADAKFILEGSSTLGSQNSGVNSCYFWQNSGIRRIQMYGLSHQPAPPVEVGDIIDVLVDFDLQKIYYWNNSKYLGELESTKTPLVEREIFPAANLSQDTQVTFRNYDRVFLIGEDDRLTKIAMNGNCFVPWNWSTNIQKKSAIIDTDLVADKIIIASRSPENPHGVNPTIMTSIPFTRSNTIFQVHINKLGSWIAVGLADIHLHLNGEKPVGSQSHCFNTAYFWREDGVSRITMKGEIGKQAGGVAPGVTVTIKLDIATQRVDYYLDYIHQGSLKARGHNMNFGELFPCVSLSKGTEVMIDNDLSTFQKKQTKLSQKNKILVSIKKLFK